MTPRTAALALLLCAAAPGARADITSSAIAQNQDPNKRCKIDGPKIEARATASCFYKIVEKIRPGLGEDHIKLTPVNAHEESYCMCARMIGFGDHARHYAQIAGKAKKITKDGTKELTPWAQYYGLLIGQAYCGENGGDKPAADAFNPHRQKYTDVVGAYIKLPIDKPLMGKPAPLRDEALKALADVEQYAKKICRDNEGAKGEDETVRGRLVEEIAAGNMADNKK